MTVPTPVLRCDDVDHVIVWNAPKSLRKRAGYAWRLLRGQDRVWQVVVNHRDGGKEQHITIVGAQVE